MRAAGLVCGVAYLTLATLALYITAVDVHGWRGGVVTGALVGGVNLAVPMVRAVWRSR